MGSSLAEATELKNKGNEAFKKQDWPTAIEWYTKAIEAYDKEPSFYTNRAQVRLFIAGQTPARDQLPDFGNRPISNWNRTV